MSEEQGKIEVTLADGSVVIATIHSNSATRLTSTWDEVRDAATEDRPIRFMRVEDEDE